MPIPFSQFYVIVTAYGQNDRAEWPPQESAVTAYKNSLSQATAYAAEGDVFFAIMCGV